MHKLATEVLDFKDDDGALLRQIFSSYEDIPECIKQANLNPPNNHQFALIDGEFKKFAMHDQGNTWLSLIYFSVNKDKLPEDDPMRRRPDISKAKITFDFEPKTDIEEGLHRFIKQVGNSGPDI